MHNAPLNSSSMAGLGLASPIHVAGEGWNPGLKTDPEVVGLYLWEQPDPVHDWSVAGLNPLEFYDHVHFIGAAHEGDGAGGFAASGEETHIKILDANLASNFPMKSGTGNQIIGVGFWYKCPASSSVILGKWKAGAYSWCLTESAEANPAIDMFIGWNAGLNFEQAPARTGSMTSGNWYFVVASFRADTGAYFIGVYDPSVPGWTTVSNSFTQPQSLTTAGWQLNGQDGISGYGVTGLGTIDNLSVWARTFNAASAEDLRTGVLNPATDADCKAYWKFEWGSFLEDSKGGNDFPYVAPTISTADKKEGSGALSLAYTPDVIRQMAARSDGQLSAAFPLKNGTANKSYGFGMWFQPHAKYNDWSALWTKYAATGYVGHWAGFGNSGVNFQTRFDTGSTDLSNGSVTVNHWYYVGCSWNEAARKQRFYLWDDTTKTLLQNVDQTRAAGNIVITADPLRLGAFDFVGGRFTDALIDEFAIFSRGVSLNDWDKVRRGKYKF